jgi:hypothetical protein
MRGRVQLDVLVKVLNVKTNVRNGTQVAEMLGEGFNLEPAVEREKAVEDIYVQREFTKLVATFWVMRGFVNFLGA